MGWFLLFQLLGLAVLLLLLYGYCRYKKVGLFSMLWHKIKWVVIAEAVVFLVIVFLCWKPLYNTTHCYFRGKSMKAETKYSWYLGECQIKTKSGSYVPIKTSRGTPDGGIGSDDADESMYYQ